MQFMPSMTGKHWEKWDADNPLLNKLTRKTVEQSCILSIFRVRFNFYAAKYQLKKRSSKRRMSSIRRALSPSPPRPKGRERRAKDARVPNAVAVPFAMLEDIYTKRIEFDKKDPKGPEQLVLKTGMCS
jgi:hypothetical protein